MNHVLPSNVTGRFAPHLVRAALSVLLLAGAFASSLSVLSPVSAQDSSGIADSIPDSALFYGEFELDPESDQFLESKALLERANLDMLLTDDLLTGFESDVPDLEAFLDGDAGFFLAELPSIEGLSLDDIMSDAAGVGMDPSMASGEDLPAGWALVFRPSDVEASFDQYVQYVSDFLGDGSAEPVESEYNGYTILTQEPIDEFSAGTSIARVQDVIVVSSVPEDIEPVIDTVEGDLEPLSGDESYNAVRDELESDVLAAGYVNGPALLEAFNEQEPEGLASSPDELVSSLGAHQGFVFWADDPGFRLDSVAIPAEGTEVPDAQAFEPTFAANVPADSLFYAGGTDLGENPALDALALIAAQAFLGIDPLDMATPIADPEAYADEIFAEAETAMGFNIKTDVLDQLVGEWALAGSVSGIMEVEPSVTGIFVTQVNDDETVGNVVATITNMISSQPGDGVTISSRQVEGSDITVVDLTDGGFPFVVEFGVADGQLLIGINEGIDNLLLGEDDPLADDAMFRNTLAELPADYTSLFYLNVQNLIPLVEEVIGLFSMSSFLDNDPACGEYANQEEAQAAYDEDDLENWNLDLDFDGEACEDFFAPTATPEADSSGIGEIAVLSVGAVTYSEGDHSGTSAIILIED